MIPIQVPTELQTPITVSFGLVVGSFLNVVIARLPKSRSLAALSRPRSHCPKCHAVIRWYDNVPVLSYLALRGRCRDCLAGISVRYPAVELMTALLFLAVKVKFGWSWLLFVRDWPFVSLLVAITFIDLDHRIIPDELSLGGLVLGLVTSLATPGLGLVLSISGAALGFCVFYGLAWVYLRLARKSGLGGGDIKLLAMLGSFLGPSGVFTTVLVSSVFGSLAGLGIALAQRRKSVFGLAIPYGPFLVVGALYYYLLGELLWLPFTIPT